MFSGNVDMVQGTDDQNLVVIWITVWIKEGLVIHKISHKINQVGIYIIVSYTRSRGIRYLSILLLKKIDSMS